MQVRVYEKPAFRREYVVYMVKLFRVIVITLIFLLAASCMPRGKADSFREPWEEGKPLKPVKLTFLLPSKEHDRFSDIKDELEEKAKSKLNVELDFICTDSGYVFYQELLESKLNSNDGIDAFITYDAYLGNLKKEGKVADLTGLFPKYAPTYSGQFTKEQLAPAVFDGRLVAIPQCRLPEMNRLYAVVREDLLKKYNITSISSYPEYEKFLEAVKKNEKKIYPLLTYNNTLSLFAEYYGYVVFDSSFGLVYRSDDPDMKLMAWEQAPEYREAVNTLYRWKQNGYINDGFTNQPLYIETEITGGGYASYLMPYRTAERYNLMLQKAGVDTWRYREFDLYPGEKSYWTTSSGSMLALNKNSKNIKRMLMFLEWLQTDQQAYDLMMYGIKSKDYVLNGKARPGIPGDYSEEYSYSTWSGKNIFYNYNNERMDNAERKEYIQTIKNKSEPPPHLGFHIDHEALYELIGSFDIKRNTFYMEYLINGGYYRKGDLDAYINGQSEITRFIIIEMQRQINIWSQSNLSSSSGKSGGD